MGWAEGGEYGGGEELTSRQVKAVFARTKPHQYMKYHQEVLQTFMLS